MSYAENTSVSVERSKAEIERILTRYGAKQFVQGWDDTRNSMRAFVQFMIDDRIVRISLEMPSKEDEMFWKTDTGKKRKSDAAYKEWERSIRQRFRALSLVIKAKLEAVESGIATFEEEFLPHIVLPDGKTVGFHVLPEIARAYETNEMPKLLAWNG